MEIARLVLDYLKVLAWPVVLGSVLVAYRSRLSAMLPRLSGVSAGGVSATFESSLVQATALTSSHSRATLPPQVVALAPSNYHEAREIGDQIRANIPVLLDLTELSDEDAKRIIDFSAGLAYATSGTIERVRNRVYLITAGTTATEAATSSVGRTSPVS